MTSTEIVRALTWNICLKTRTSADDGSELLFALCSNRANYGFESCKTCVIVMILKTVVQTQTGSEKDEGSGC